MPSLKAGLNLFTGQYPHHHPHPRAKFDSALLLRWARQVEEVILWDTGLGWHGLDEFLAAATRLTHVHMDSCSPLAAAQADRLLNACSAVTRLSLAGSCMPCNFPSTVTELQAAFRNDDDCALHKTQCDALLYRADSLPHLEDLSLTFDGDGRIPVVLTCPIQLAQLQVLYLGLDVSSVDVDLSWVQLQARPRVENETGFEFDCFVHVDMIDPAMHRAVVAQLSPFAIRELTLYLDTPFTCIIQKLWSQLNICSLILAFHDLALCAASEALQVLPLSCTRVDIEAKHLRLDRVIYISSAALFCQPANIRVTTEACIEIVGAGAACMTAPDRMQQPWQFVVQGAKSVHGLPPSLATNKTYFQQNAAACKAGWTDDTE